MNKTCPMCGNELQPWSTGKNHCNMCGNVYDINETIVIYTSDTASSNKTVYDYLKKITDEDPTVKLRKINKLARSLIDDMDIAFEDDTLDDIDTIFTYDTLLEIVRLSEEKKCYYCGSKVDLVDVKGYNVCMACMQEGEK